jgi:hypothetical protein
MRCLQVHDRVRGAGCSGSPSMPGAVGVAGHKQGVPPLTAGGEAQGPDKVSQHFSIVVMAALHETSELMAAQGTCNGIVVFHGMTASARPEFVVEGDRVDARVDASRIPEGLID